MPLDQQQQFRPQQLPTNLQRQPVPEQKFIRNPVPPQNQNMMAEMNRERTFTTSHEGSMDDDDDVVVGRMVTPQARPNVSQKPVENYDQRPNMQQQQQQPPTQQQRPIQQPLQQPLQQPMMQRRESVQSIPSRPPSGMGSNNSQSPEPRVSPMPPQNVVPSNIQPHQQNRTDNNKNLPNELNRQSPSNYDNTRDQMDYNDKVERVQRPNQSNSNVAPQQNRRTSIFAMEEPMHRQNPKIIQQPAPPQPQLRQAPSPQQISQNEAHAKPTQEPKKSQPEHFVQQQPQQQQRQQNSQDNKSNPSVLKQQEQKRTVVDTKPVDIQNIKNSVRLDLGKSENIKSAKDKSPSSKKKKSYFGSHLKQWY